MLVSLDSAAHIFTQAVARAAGWVFQIFHSRWTLITGAVSLGAGLTKILPWVTTKYQAWSDYRLLKRRVGADLYTREDLIRATEYYVEADCQATDPAGQEDFRRVAPMRSPAHRTLRNLLHPSSEQRFLILLADSGMGKTTLLMNLYARYGREKRGDYKIVLVPLGHAKTDEIIAAVRDKGNTVLFLDAFDEDTKAIHNSKERVAALVELSKDFSRVLMTCRTQFFETDAEIPQETGLLKIGTIRAGQSRTYAFSKLYLSPFSESQIERYICKRFVFWKRDQRRRAREIVAEAPDLTMRPMLLSHIPDLISRNYRAGNAASLYKTMTEAWFIREKPLVEPDPLRRFSIALARDIYSRREQRGAEKIAPEEALAIAHDLNIPLESWQMRGRSLLNRDSEGKLKFSHRSLMEYFFIVGFLDDPSAYTKGPWTDQMKRFWWDMINTRQYRRDGTSRYIGLASDIQDARVHGDPSGLSKLGVRSIVTAYGYGILHSTRSEIEDKSIPWMGPFLLERVSVKPSYGDEFKKPKKCVIDLALGLLWDADLAMKADYSQALEHKGKTFSWRLPTPYEAASLLPGFSSDNSDPYPAGLFDKWANTIWVVDDEGTLKVLSYSDAAAKPAVRNYDPSVETFIRLVKTADSSGLMKSLIEGS
jgi:hypothetical protein